MAGSISKTHQGVNKGRRCYLNFVTRDKPELGFGETHYLLKLLTMIFIIQRVRQTAGCNLDEGTIKTHVEAARGLAEPYRIGLSLGGKAMKIRIWFRRLNLIA